MNILFHFVNSAPLHIYITTEKKNRIYGSTFSVTCPLAEDRGNAWETCLLHLRYIVHTKMIRVLKID